MRFIAKILGTSALIWSIGLGASAQQEAFQVDAIVQALDAGPATRSLNNPATAMLSADQFIPPNYDFPSHTMYIPFESGGHMITYEGMSTLRSLAAALLDPKMEGFRFQVGAHLTQSSDALPMTSRRAQVIVDHLVTFYNIPREMLIPVGYGNMKLANPSLPMDASNERIEFINVTSLK